MTKWKHKTDLGWMMARQECLTATDIKDLLPVTKTGRKRTVTEDAYIGVLAHKLCVLTEDDCMSYGLAARGHILEPYAVDLYNTLAMGKEDKLHHWDDATIVRKPFVKYSLGFSPDALDIPQPPNVGGYMLSVDNVKHIGEVKSYSSSKHLICANTPKEDLEERWQVATAMAVCPSIEQADLLFYNPSMPKDMLYVVEYSRSDLAGEIDTVLEVEDNWLTFLNNYTAPRPTTSTRVVGGPLEQDIIAKIMKDEELNPEGERSVMT